ncbi:MAG: hypothetical protein KDD82_28530 [Planctomycetes bacterium]|nr:hypothetical protein [Planctomycetota bacterium]
MARALSSSVALLLCLPPALLAQEPLRGSFVLEGDRQLYRTPPSATLTFDRDRAGRLTVTRVDHRGRRWESSDVDEGGPDGRTLRAVFSPGRDGLDAALQGTAELPCLALYTVTDGGEGLRERLEQPGAAELTLRGVRLREFFTVEDVVGARWRDAEDVEHEGAFMLCRTPDRRLIALESPASARPGDVFSAAALTQGAREDAIAAGIVDGEAHWTRPEVYVAHGLRTVDASGRSALLGSGGAGAGVPLTSLGLALRATVERVCRALRERHQLHAGVVVTRVGPASATRGYLAWLMLEDAMGRDLTLTLAFGADETYLGQAFRGATPAGELLLTPRREHLDWLLRAYRSGDAGQVVALDPAAPAGVPAAVLRRIREQQPGLFLLTRLGPDAQDPWGYAARCEGWPKAVTFFDANGVTLGAR